MMVAYSKGKVAMAVGAGLIALGLVLALAGYALAGFDARVFTMQIDGRDDAVSIGGREIAYPDEIPLLNFFVTGGNEISVNASGEPLG